MKYIKQFFALFMLVSCLCACRSEYEFREKQIIKLEETIKNSCRAKFNLPAYPRCEKETKSDFFGRLDEPGNVCWRSRNLSRYIRGAQLTDFENNSIFVFYYKEAGGKYVLLKEESYFYKNKFQKWFGEASPENVYIRMLFSYEDGKFIGIDLYENSLDENGGLVSSHRELSPEKMREILAEWKK